LNSISLNAGNNKRNSNMKNFIQSYLRNSIEVKENILNNQELVDLIQTVSKVIIEAYKRGNKVLIAGNGGSAADAQHIAGELVSKFNFDRPGLPAIALTVDTSILTAIGNDYGYEKSFSRQVQANGNKGDIFIGISTSGNSINIINAVEESKNKGIISIGFTGNQVCKMDELCDYCIKIPSNETSKIQESHIMIGHIICAIVEKTLFPSQ
jgi:D-sedoheptulose 7-phosphate isomerase